MKSLYIHIPFCKWVCHYCDFAKTANHTGDLMQSYLNWLHTELSNWLTTHSPGLDTVFFGGGTPSLYGKEYQPIMQMLANYLRPNAEVTLEANPDDITTERLRIWRELGFNRLSLGVQSFDPQGLAFMTRQHGADDAKRAIERCLNVFGNVNIDLIYGWPAQTPASWHRDLLQAAGLGVPHLSLYCLTFEPRTVIGRRYDRGKLTAPVDDELWHRYEEARAALSEHGYSHEEVSNWCKPGHSCRHNWTYWTDEPFLGVGVGAHGYLVEDRSNFGKRYHYPYTSVSLRHGSQPVFEDRTPEQWLLEYLGSSLRTCRGVSLSHISSKADLVLKPRANLQHGIEAGLVIIENNTLRLKPSEWFRETAWAGAIESCFAPAGPEAGSPLDQ